MKINYKLFLFCLLICQQAVALEKLISIEEVQLHGIANNCWIIINNKVYDVTKFIKNHDAKCKNMKLIDFCGKDASTVWMEKQKSDNAHKRKSILNLEGSRIGTLR